MPSRSGDAAKADAPAVVDKTTTSAPAPRRGRPSSRDRIIEAAIGLVEEVGAGHMSLEAVAERAGVSKGGLLYNFPNKVALLKALVAEHLIEQEIRRSDAEADLPSPRNCAAAGFLATAAADLDCEHRAPSGFLAAIAESPDLLEPLRARNAALANRLRAAEDPDLSLIAFLVVEGIKTMDLFEVNPLDAAERRRVLDRLAAMLARGD